MGQQHLLSGLFPEDLRHRQNGGGLDPADYAIEGTLSAGQQLRDVTEGFKSSKIRGAEYALGAEMFQTATALFARLEIRARMKARRGSFLFWGKPTPFRYTTKINVAGAQPYPECETCQNDELAARILAEHVCTRIALRK